MSDYTPRSISDLTEVGADAWPFIEQSAAEAPHPVTVLPPDRSLDTLFRLQVTVRSALGALAWNTGGLLVDDGWLKVLGCGAQDLAGLADANGLGQPSAESKPPGLLIVAFDALGGRFAINGGALDGQPGDVNYFGADALTWQPLGAGHGAFVEWTLSDELEEFYEDLRWPGWREEVAALTPGQGLSLFPPPWSQEGKDLAATSRKAVPVAQLATLHADTAAHMAPHVES